MFESDGQEGSSASGEPMVVEKSDQTEEPASNSSASSLNKGRFSNNLMANIISFALTMGIGLCFTPYLIHHLGIAAYGLVPLTINITSYLGLVTLALNSAVGRYITIALEKGDEAEANRVFNTSFIGIVFLAMVVFIIGLVGVSKIESLLNLPKELVTQARYLMGCTLVSFLLTEVATPFGVSTFCRNRFDLRGLLNNLSLIVRVVTTVLAFSFAIPNLLHVGLGYVTSALVILVGSIIISKRLIPCLRLRTSGFEVAMLRKLFGTGGWIVVNQIGTLLYLSIDLLVINQVLGAYAGGQYAAVMMWSSLLRGIAGTIAGVFGPTILYHYAQDNIEGLIRYSQQSVKFLGLLIALPIGLVCGFSRPLLHLWLGDVFVPLAPLMSLMTIHLCVNLAVLPLFSVNVATNHVKWPGIVTCVTGIMNLGLAVLLSGPMKWGLYGVAGAGAIMLTAKNAIFTPIYGAKVVRKPWYTFYGVTVPVIVSTCLVAAGCSVLAHFYNLGSWPRLILAGIAVSITYAGFVFALLLSKAERRRVLKVIPFFGGRATGDSDGSADANHRLMAWQRAFLVLFLLNALVLGRDIYPVLYKRLVHVRMMQQCEDSRYRDAVGAVAAKWMQKPPTVAATDERHWLIIEDLKRMRKDPLSVSWPQAVLTEGICDLHRVKKDPQLLKLVSGYLERVVKADGTLAHPVKSVEQVAFGNVLLYMYDQTRDKKYLSAARQLVEFCKQEAANKGGTVPYEQNGPLRLVDTLPMICPFLAKYGVSQNDPAALALAAKQLVEYTKYGLDQPSGVPIHAYNPEVGNMSVGGVGWGRGAGWYARGLVDTVKELPESVPERKYLEDCVRSFCSMAEKCQLSDGGWGSKLAVDRDFESSGTALIANSLFEAAREGIINDRKCMAAVNKALVALKKHTRTDGTVDCAEGNCMGVGKYSSLSVPTPYAQGAVLSLMAHMQEAQTKPQNGKATTEHE